MKALGFSLSRTRIKIPRNMSQLAKRVDRVSSWLLRGASCGGEDDTAETGMFSELQCSPLPIADIPMIPPESLL